MDARGKLVELLQVDLSGSDGYEPELIADYLIANGVTVQEWIPVTDRLPKESGDYIVYYSITASNKPLISIRHFYGESPEAFLHNKAMTHWMPLPEPPKEE